MDFELGRMNEIIELQSAIDDRQPERRRTGLAGIALTPLTLLFLSAGFVFGGLAPEKPCPVSPTQLGSVTHPVLPPAVTWDVFLARHCDELRASGGPVPR